MTFLIKRRHVISTAAAGLLSCPWAAIPATAHPDDGTFVSQIAASRPVTRFIESFGNDLDDYRPASVPDWFIDWCETSHRRNVAPVSPSIERRQAMFFARFAVTFVAPHYLRTAGYLDLATACERDTDVYSERNSAAAADAAFVAVCVARHTGPDIVMKTCKLLSSREGMAFGAASQARYACSAARSDDQDYFANAGDAAGMALIQALFEDDHSDATAPNPAETRWIWSVAHAAITQALRIAQTEPPDQPG